VRWRFNQQIWAFYVQHLPQVNKRRDNKRNTTEKERKAKKRNSKKESEKNPFIRRKSSSSPSHQLLAHGKELGDGGIKVAVLGDQHRAENVDVQRGEHFLQLDNLGVVLWLLRRWCWRSLARRHTASKVAPRWAVLDDGWRLRQRHPRRRLWLGGRWVNNQGLEGTIHKRTAAHLHNVLSAVGALGDDDGRVGWHGTIGRDAVVRGGAVLREDAVAWEGANLGGGRGGGGVRFLAM
jgi:hypothetical protein